MLRTFNFRSASRRVNINDNPFEYNDYDDYNEYDDVYYNNYIYLRRENDLNQVIHNINVESLNSNTLESLLSTPQIINPDNSVQEEDLNILTSIDSQKRNKDNIKEDLLYYFSSPESLSNFKNNLEEEIKYDFYKDLDSSNFLLAQKERFKLILSISKSDIDSKMKISKLNDFNYGFCSKLSIMKENEQLYKSLNNASLIGTKIDQLYFLYSKQDIDEEKIIIYLNELKSIFNINKIDMESLGLLHFNSNEKNLILLLSMFENKLNVKKNKENLTELSIICLDILKCFKSTKLYFYIIRYIKQYKEFLDLNKLDQYKEMIHFIPNICLDFNQLNQNINIRLINDIRKPLIDKGIIKDDLNVIELDIKDYTTLNYDDYLLLFIGDKNVLKGNNNEYYFYYKIDLISKNILDIGKIYLLNEEENNIIDIIDVNISIKKELIFIFYIVEDSDNYSLKYKIYNKYSLTFIKEGEIDLKKPFIPKRLYNDNNYLYCISDINEVLIIKLNSKLDYQKYMNYSFRLFENDLMYYTEKNDLSLYKMYNSLCINNLLILYNTSNNKSFIAKIIIKENKNCIINIFSMGEKSEIKDSVKIAYNECKFIVSKIMNRDYGVYYNMTSKNFNNLIDKGIALLPFNSKIMNNNNSHDFYEYLIQEYSSFLNLCGNFELINAEKEKNLIKFPFDFCCNFDQNILYFLIDNIIENDISDNTKLNYIIILKQIICCLYNTKLFKEEIVEKIIPYFKKLILNMINSKEKKLFNKILREIIDISSYIKNNTIIDIDEIKFVFDEGYHNISIKSKFLLIGLLLKQNKMKNSKGLYEYIIKLEKNYLTNIFNAKSFDLSNYYLFKELMINASDSLFNLVKTIQDELISLIPYLLDNIQELIELYKKSTNNEKNNLEHFSFIYNSFIFRSLYFIIEYLIANKIILKKEYLIPIYKMILIMDKFSIDSNHIFDMNNIIEITNNSFNNNGRNTDYYYGYNRKILKIKLKEEKDIIIKTNILPNKESLKSIRIRIKSKQTNNNIQAKLDNNVIYRGTSEITVEIESRNISKTYFIINIIPLKNEKLFNLYQTNKDYKIISLIGKSLLHYILSLFEEINTQIEKYNNDKIVKSHRKIFQTEIFEYISIPLDIIIKSNSKGNSQFNDLINNEIYLLLYFLFIKFLKIIKG